MELWIRSQNKKILQKVNKLYATTYSEEAGYGIYDLRYDDLEDIDDCDVPLGFYKSKERALEVLDEIQNLLQPKIKYIQEEPIESIIDFGYQITQNVDMKIQEINRIVYKMPKE